MTLETEGIIFRQTRMVQGRRMILLFTRKYGKISVGSNVGDKGRSRTALALKPFTFGNYQIYEGRNYYELDRADAVTSYYGIGEDLDRYAAAAYALELTEKVVPEGLPQPQVFDLLISFFQELEQRKKKYTTLLLAYEVKLLDVLGIFPVLGHCVSCGKTFGAGSAQGSSSADGSPAAGGSAAVDSSAGDSSAGEIPPAPAVFSVKDGGVLCADCAAKAHFGDGSVKAGEGSVNLAPNGEESLIFPAHTDIINVVKYYARNPMQKFAGIALSDDVANRLQSLVKAYISYHFDIGDLKSEELLGEK